LNILCYYQLIRINWRKLGFIKKRMQRQEAREAGAQTTQQSSINPQFAALTLVEPYPAPSSDSRRENDSMQEEKVGSFPHTSDCTTPSSIGKDEHTYPEGGLRAWLVVFGSWCALLAALGTMNSIGSYQSYLITHQLTSYSPGTVGWIFSIYAALAFAAGLFIGPAFDKYGAKWLVIGGSIGVCLTMFLLGICEQYWHFLLVFGFLGGGSTSLLFTPAIAAIGHFFNQKRGNATGIAATGGAIGGVVFPLMLEALIPKIGFAWSTRIIGFIYVGLCAVACIFIRTRLPPEKNANAKPDFRIFKDPAFAITVLGVYLLEWALFVPLTYISSYALYQGFSTDFSFQVLVILNVGSIFGRWLPGFYADKIGRYNTMILTTILTVVSVLGIWLPVGGTKAGIVVFALLFGLASGSNISLTPVCIGQLCRTENYGRYYATCYTIVSIGCLTGIPIVGEIIAKNNGDYWGLIVFVGVCYVVGLAAFVIVRVLNTGRKLRVVF
jgi:MFS family permease